MLKRMIALVLALMLCAALGTVAAASGEASDSEPITVTEIEDMVSAASSASALHLVYRQIANAYNAGTILDENGQELPADPAKAAEYFLLAGATGDGYDYVEAGQLYEQGLVTGEPDYAAAMDCYILAAGASNSSCKGVRNIGQWYDNGNDFVERDPRIAAAWYVWAIMLDDASSCYYLGNLYQQGDITWDGKPDYAAAAKYYQMAADKNNDSATGVAKALYWLGYLYENGLGVDMDTDMARALYERAAAAGEVKLEELYNRAVTAVERLG